MSTVVRQGACDDCGSSDACTWYDDGHTFCFACQTHHNARSTPVQEEGGPIKGLLTDLNYEAFTARGLSEETSKFWRYGWTELGDSAVQVAQYCTPNGQVVAQKIRTADKKFAWRGEPKRAGLYGRHLWRDSGKMIVVTEGEIDAMSVSQIQDHKWPVVSVPNGAQSASSAVAKDLEWLEKFERVIFMFDSDKPGQDAALECAALLSPGKAYIATLPLKDANDMLKEGRGAEVVAAIWGAKQYRPDGVLAGTELWDRINNPKQHDSLPYPFPELNAITHGCRRSEVTTVTAGTGIGKSEFVRHIAAHFHDHHNETIGYIALEESVERTAMGLMGLHLGKRIHLDNGSVTDAERRAAFDATVGSGRYYLYDHFGSLESDHLLSRIRYMVRGCGCGTVILDHLSIVVSGIETDDERRTIDKLMTNLRSMVQELNFRLIVINHLKRLDKGSHEEGGQVSLSHLRGSGSIAQISNMVIALERNQQGETDANVSHIRVLKNRHTGQTGPAGSLSYDPDSGRLTPTQFAAPDPAPEPTKEKPPF